MEFLYVKKDGKVLIIEPTFYFYDDGIKQACHKWQGFSDDSEPRDRMFKYVWDHQIDLSNFMKKMTKYFPDTVRRPFISPANLQHLIDF